MCKEQVVKIYSTLEIRGLINHEGVDIATYINFDKQCVENLENTVANNMSKLCIPTLEELCPYNRLIHEYIDIQGIEIPAKESASHFLRQNNMMQEFYQYREEMATKALEQWLLKEKVQIVMIDTQ